MKRNRILIMPLLLSAALLFPCAVMACAHYPGQVEYPDLIQVGYVAPQVGVPGSTGDRICPVPGCGAVCVPAKEIPALPEPADHPASTDGENDTAGGGPAEVPAAPAGEGTEEKQETRPEEPVSGGGQGSAGQPEQPAAVPPEVPAQEARVQPEQPAAVPPEAPAQESQVRPEQPAAVPPEAPAQESQVRPEQPAAAPPETPGQEAQVRPEQPADSSAPESGKTERETPAQDPGKKEKPAGQTAQAGAAGQDESPLSGSRKGRYFFRRTHFRPEPGIRAEAAGERIWPAYATPFQQMGRP